MKKPRIVRIKNTLETAHIEVSAPLYEELDVYKRQL